MEIDLPALCRRKGIRRDTIRLRPIKAKPGDVAALESVYLDVVDLWAAHTDTILLIYRPLVRDAKPEDVEREIAIVEVQVGSLFARITGRVKAWADKTEEHHREAFRAGILTATEIDLGTVLSPSDVTQTVEATVARNVALIRGLSDAQRKAVAETVFRGVTQRTPAVQVAKELREIEAMSRRRAVFIAGDQTIKLNASLDRARQEQSGITHFTWRHSGKVHYRPEHKAREGKLYAWNKAPADLPGQLPNCGCVAQATLTDLKGKPI